jgi:tRNA threonylcarbamoyladenosine biosynthesis protein TsaE
MIALADAAATRALGARLAGLVRGGDAIALVGDLGAGKTTFTAGFAAALGAEATSPTFSLVNEYAARGVLIWHVDLYRVVHARELPELGIDELAGNPAGVLLVEWADQFPEVLPADHLRLEFAHVADARTVTTSGTGPRGRELASLL